MATTVYDVIPVIDMSPFTNNVASKDEKDKVVNGVRNACEQIGFFIIKGHGIPTKTVEQIFSIGQELFDLPPEQKILLDSSGSGYVPMGRENLAATLNVATPADIKESFNISSREAQNKWPNLANFKEISMDYFDRMVKLASSIMRIFALALNLSENYFDEFIAPPYAVLRFLNYPELDNTPLPNQLRAGEHTDYGTLTIVRPDSPGLQVRDRSERWIDVIAPPDSFVVNIGDMMQRWTNDTWVSTLHRVANPSNHDNHRRLSVVFFHNPRDEVEISCLSTCHSDTYPKRHLSITAGEHRRQKSRKSRE